MNHRNLFLCLAALLGLWSGPAAAQSGVQPATYGADGSRLFWFVQISDTHVSTFFNNNYGDRLSWALTEGVAVVEPWFVVATGDLSDSTDGVVYGTGPHFSEWTEYRFIVQTSGLATDFYFDLPGNHDAYGDGDLNFYRMYSWSAPAYGTTQPHWALVFSHGVYHFLGAATPSNDGLQWPFDNTAITDGELAEVQAHLDLVPEATFNLLMGHHPLSEVDGWQALVALMHDRGASHWLCGHKHDLWTQVGGGVVQHRINSLGQKDKENFGIYTIDGNMLVRSVVGTDDPWPAIAVSAPATAGYGGETSLDRRKQPWDEDDWVEDPYAVPVPRQCAQAPVRVLVFDPVAVTSVRLRIDGGPWSDLSPRIAQAHQWRGSFDATGLPLGLHLLEVRAVASQERTVAVPFRVADGVCELGDPDPDNPFEPGDRETWPLPQTDGDQDEEAEVEEPQEGEAREEAPACTPQERLCAQEAVVECQNDGSWAGVEDCASQGRRCQEGQCVDNPDGDDDLPSDTGEELKEGPAACPEGSKRCEGNLLMQCDQGGAWAVYTDCSPRLCVEDACVTPDGDEEAEQDDGQTEVVTGGSDDGCATGGGSVLLLAVALLCLSRASRRRRGASPNGPDCRHPAT